MRKLFFITSLIVCICFCFLFAIEKVQSANNYDAVCVHSEVKEKSTKTDSVIALLLYKNIDEAIQNYYGEPTQFALYDATVTNISQIDNQFRFNVSVAVPTFHGAHNPPFGLETITFEVSTNGITLISYEHKNIA